MNVQVAHDDLAINVRALVDTGAPRTVFGRAVADAIGIELGRGARQWRVKLLGREWDAESAYVLLTLPPFNDMAWETEALFLLQDVDMPFEGLLGTIGFLDRWVVSFDYYDSLFVVEERESFQARLPVDLEREFLENYDSEWAPPGT